MLIRNAILERIRSGEVTLAFRRWRRPTVKSDGTLHTSVGLLEIRSLEEVTLGQITVADVKKAGYPSKQALAEELEKRNGPIFRIALAYAGADPRIKLRQESKLSETDLNAILTRLQRMDSRSQSGSWTLRVLTMINEHPKTLAADLAAELGCEKLWLKANVRKLKNLGLTISHDRGYTLSPRGLAVITCLRNDA